MESLKKLFGRPVIITLAVLAALPITPKAGVYECVTREGR